MVMMREISVVGPWYATNEQRYRVDWRGRVILQIKEERSKGSVSCGIAPTWTGVAHRWRDATAEDLINKRDGC